MKERRREREVRRKRSPLFVQSPLSLRAGIFLLSAPFLFVSRMLIIIRMTLILSRGSPLKNHLFMAPSWLLIFSATSLIMPAGYPVLSLSSLFPALDFFETSDAATISFLAMIASS